MSQSQSRTEYLLCDFLDGGDRRHVKVATATLVVDEQAVFDAALDGLLRRLHHLCSMGKQRARQQRGPITQRGFTRGKDLGGDGDYSAKVHYGGIKGIKSQAREGKEEYTHTL